MTTIEKIEESLRQVRNRELSKLGIEEIGKKFLKIRSTEYFSTDFDSCDSEYVNLTSNSCVIVSINRECQHLNVDFIYLDSGNIDEYKFFNYVVKNKWFPVISEIGLKEAENTGYMTKIKGHIITEFNEEKLLIARFRNHYEVNKISLSKIYSIIDETQEIVEEEIPCHPVYNASIEEQKKLNFHKEKLNTKIKMIGIELKYKLKLNLDDDEISNYYNNFLAKDNILDYDKNILRAEFVSELGYKLRSFSSAKKISEIKYIFDKEIYAMDEVKSSLIRYLVTRKNNGGNNKIICLVGNPGVGKSKIVSAISKILDCEAYKISCNGIKGTGEELLSGHSFTYAGSSPGEIAKAYKQDSPFIVFEEIDKISDQNRLITLLDPENSANWKDLYMQTPLDFSKALFLLTANNISNINPILLDRLEIINVRDYTYDERLTIAKRFIIPKIYKNEKIDKKIIQIEEDILKTLSHTKSLRKIKEYLTTLITEGFVEYCKSFEEGKEIKRVVINLHMAEEILGEEEFYNEKIEKYDLLKNEIGTANILAVRGSSEGILSQVIALKINDRKGQVSVNGNISEIIKESATNIVALIKGKYAHIDSVKKVIKNNDSIIINHARFSTPKDGVSGGVSTFLAVYSAITEKEINLHEWASTGEVCLNANVYAIGGENYKIECCEELGIKNILIPEENRKRVERYITTRKTPLKLNIHYIRTIDEALKLVFKTKGS